MPEEWTVRRKRFAMPFLLGVIAGLAFGFAGGLVFISFIHSSMAGDWESWQYTGATTGSGSSMWGGGFAGPGSMARGQLLGTTDSFEQVSRFYAQKAGLGSVPPGSASGAFRTRTNTGNVDQDVIYLTDSTRADGQARTVKSQAFASRSAGGSVVVLISRADGEEHTHIVIYWLPRR